MNTQALDHHAAITRICENEFGRNDGGYAIRAIHPAAVESLDGFQSYVAIVARWYTSSIGGEHVEKETRVMGFRKHAKGYWVNTFNMLA